MFSIPLAQEVTQFHFISPLLIDHLVRFDAEIDPSKIQILSKESVTWNDGSLGCPMPGKSYTQAIVPGFLIWLQAEGKIFEVHTNSSFTSFAMPGVGNF